MATNVLAKVYETLLCSPGMNEAVKIDVRVNRKTMLLLNSMVENSMSKDTGQSRELLELIPATDLEELKAFSAECLQKAGLTEFSEKVKTLHALKQ